ncbi:hypothetical protein DNI29_19965 [Hymenobacter sediminis]|uniref:hypothetical protein n=1 Tax=Hymenobacter sediminis TaxID=2218621 RepID=UPI000F4D8C58|nr:hypothetical protein [Hymenobacter sediminis]RPD44972.1 hypothetical protein DNI29_19965 [Hymenobacter sediminis]
MNLLGCAAITLLLTAECAGQNGVLVIRHGGTYSGTYRSTDSEVPCVLIATEEPVILENCYLEGPGNLIDARGGNADLQIRNCTGRGLPPTADNIRRGRFLEANEARRLWVEHNDLLQTAGIVAYLWQGSGQPDQTLRIRYNRVENLDGRHRNGGGTTVSFVSLIGVRGVAGMEVAWNQVRNEPNNSLVEDNINIYNSSGTARSPLRIHDNYVQGAYPYPATSPRYAGSGLTSDGDGATPLTTTAYLEAYDNQFVSTCAAMNIAAGHHVRYYRNRMVTSGLLPNGEKMAANYAGAGVWNEYKKPSTVFFANSMEKNTIGFVKLGYNQPFSNRHDLSQGACEPCTATEHLPNPITLETEHQEWEFWQQKLARYHIKPGVKK